MTQIGQAISAHLPGAARLDPAAVKAVRAYFPGKLLGRTAALLSLALLVLELADAVDAALARALDVDLRPFPWLHSGLIICLPMLIMAVQLALEVRAGAQRRRLQALAVQTGAVPAGYFR